MDNIQLPQVGQFSCFCRRKCLGNNQEPNTYYLILYYNYYYCMQFDRVSIFIFYNILGLLVIEYPGNLSSAWFFSIFLEISDSQINVRGDNFITFSTCDNCVENLLHNGNNSPLDSHNLTACTLYIISTFGYTEYKVILSIHLRIHVMKAAWILYFHHYGKNIVHYSLYSKRP